MEEKQISPVENFDWEAYEKGEVVGEKSREELVATYDQSLNTVKDKEVIEGTVISINKREVVVNIGYKSDGVISMNEFRYNPELKVGDTVEVYIENQEDKKRPVGTFSQESPRNPFMGSRKCCSRKRRSHQGLHQVPYQRRYDCRCIRHRSLLARFANRR